MLDEHAALIRRMTDKIIEQLNTAPTDIPTKHYILQNLTYEQLKDVRNFILSFQHIRGNYLCSPSTEPTSTTPHKP